MIRNDRAVSSCITSSRQDTDFFFPFSFFSLSSLIFLNSFHLENHLFPR